MCSKKFAKFTEKRLCWSSLIKKRFQCRRFSVNFVKSLRTPPVVASVILLCWLWNHVQRQQQKNKVRFVDSFRGGVAGGVPVKQVVSGGFWVFSDGFCWLRVISDSFRWFAVLVVTRISHENFPGHRFERQIHIQTQIRLNTVLTLATKHLMIIYKDNLYLHLKAF